MDRKIAVRQREGALEGAVAALGQVVVLLLLLLFFLLLAVLARFGGAIRVAGTAEFTGFDERIDLRRVAPILDAARELFPGPLDSLRPETANPWTGLRPLTPDGPPVLGPDSRAPAGLFFNTGHGSLGWTEAAGSARLVADCIEGKPTALDLTPYSLARFRAQ